MSNWVWRFILKLRTGAEIAPDADGRIGGDGAVATQYGRDPVRRNPDCQRELVCAHSARGKFRAEDVAWVCSCACHERSPGTLAFMVILDGDVMRVRVPKSEPDAPTGVHTQCSIELDRHRTASATGERAALSNLSQD